jgi:hypothetical protein
MLKIKEIEFEPLTHMIGKDDVKIMYSVSCNASINEKLMIFDELLNDNEII